MNQRLVLASVSPRRRELLTAAGFLFDVVSPAVRESESRAFSMRELTTLNASRKARAVARRHPQSVVLAADTTVALDGESIGKPRDFEDAVTILRRLAGREHQVCTAVCVRSNRSGLTSDFCVVSHVRFHSLAEEQIRAYLKKVDPLDKAGAYAAQGHGSDIIARIDGSYTNVVGLPMEETVRALAAFDVRPAA